MGGLGALTEVLVATGSVPSGKELKQQLAVALNARNHNSSAQLKELETCTFVLRSLPGLRDPLTDCQLEAMSSAVHRAFGRWESQCADTVDDEVENLARLLTGRSDTGARVSRSLDEWASSAQAAWDAGDAPP